MGIQLYILTSNVFKECLSVLRQVIIGYGMIFIFYAFDKFNFQFKGDIFR